jgi:putative transposase
VSRELRELPLVALLIDGVHFAEQVVLAAVGVDDRGIKHVLGLREGATENADAVRALLGELVERGLDPDRSLVVVIDGAKALHKAVVEVFGSQALIQCCREHSVPGRAHSKEVRSPLTGKTFEPVSLGQVVAA